jgi:hypothetical protein
MSNTILLKRSDEAGKIPTSNDLNVGELAINTTDGVLYTKLANGSVVAIAKSVLEDEETGKHYYLKVINGQLILEEV